MTIEAAENANAAADAIGASASADSQGAPPTAPQCPAQ
jgi:hypothetical protein